MEMDADQWYGCWGRQTGHARQQIQDFFLGVREMF